VSKLINELFFVQKHDRLRVIKDRLILAGSASADEVLTELNRRRPCLRASWHTSATVMQVTALLQVLKQTSTAIHTDRVLKLLDWDEIALDPLSRSPKALVLETLGRIAGPRIIPALEKFGCRIQELECITVKKLFRYYTSSTTSERCRELSRAVLRTDYSLANRLK
jgi:hypothetical protein